MTGPIEFEFQDDFESEGQTQDASTVRRPDAVSLDYLTCFTYGPVAVGDSSEGNLSYIWRIRYVTGAVYMARSLGEGWMPDVKVFDVPNYILFPILEVDAAFDQNANIVVVCERETGLLRAKEVWIYFYDTLLSQFDFRMLTAGRTPRALLDDPYDSANSDVLIFYVTGLTDGNQRIRYRQQRDRYLVGYPTPVLSGGDPNYDYYVEDVARLVNSRIAIIYSRRNISTGRYELLRWESVLYPIFLTFEGVTLTPIYAALALTEPIVDGLVTPEGLSFTPVYAGAALVAIVIEVGPSSASPGGPSWFSLIDAEGVGLTTSYIAAVLENGIISSEIVDDSVTLTPTYISASLVILIIERVIDPEGISITPTYQAASLVTI